MKKISSTEYIVVDGVVTTIETLKRQAYDEALKDLCHKMRSRFFHQVGTQFDNAIIEIDRMALKLTK